MVNDMVQTQIIVIQKLDISCIESNATIIFKAKWKKHEGRKWNVLCGLKTYDIAN
jgi:hypothetical protein